MEQDNTWDIFVQNAWNYGSYIAVFGLLAKEILVFVLVLGNSMVYTALWIMDYYEIIEQNPGDEFWLTLSQWLRAIERIDTLGFPLRLAKAIMENLRAKASYRLTEFAFVTIFYFIFFPLAFYLYSSLTLPMIFVLPVLMVIYLI